MFFLIIIMANWWALASEGGGVVEIKIEWRNREEEAV